ncbi:hypothetical protein GGQ85_004437 [Nitrobacter vulgaris]|nr:hypothetical protein [Nitrobacter vulgaris]
MPNCTARGIELALPVARVRIWTGGEPLGSSAAMRMRKASMPFPACRRVRVPEGSQ